MERRFRVSVIVHADEIVGDRENEEPKLEFFSRATSESGSMSYAGLVETQKTISAALTGMGDARVAAMKKTEPQG